MDDFAVNNNDFINALKKYKYSGNCFFLEPEMTILKKL